MKITLFSQYLKYVYHREIKKQAQRKNIEISNNNIMLIATHQPR